MAEGEAKPKVEGKVKKPYFQPNHQGDGGAKKSQKFQAPTPGLEDVVFTAGTARDAVKFKENSKKLGRWLAVNLKTGGPMLQKAIEDMKAPIFTEPADLPAMPTKGKKKNGRLSSRNITARSGSGKK